MSAVTPDTVLTIWSTRRIDGLWISTDEPIESIVFLF